MKITKKSKSRIGRPPKPDDAPERQMVGTRLNADVYKKLVEVAAANGRSISAEMERMIERSLGPDPEDPDNQLRDLDGRVMRAFERGGWSDNPHLTAAEWLNDPLLYQNGVVHAFETFLTKHPAPRFQYLSLLLVAIRSRIEERLLAANDGHGLPLPTLDWGDHSSVAPHQQKDEG